MNSVKDLRQALRDEFRTLETESQFEARMLDQARARRRRRLLRGETLLAWVAVVIAIAILATLVATRTLQPTRAVPARTPPKGLIRSNQPQMMSASKGWAVGPSPQTNCFDLCLPGPLERTNDGGRTWTAVQLPATPFAEPDDPNAFLNAYFLGPDNAWVVRGLWSTQPQFVVFSTTNGGVTWVASSLVAIDSPVLTSHANPRQYAGTEGLFAGMYFLDPTTGWLLVSAGDFSVSSDTTNTTQMLFASTDEGLQWTLISTNNVIENDRPYVPVPTACSWTVPVFTSALDGFMDESGVNQCPADVPPRILVTSDGGRSWHPRPR